jgi:hypothetical protein
LNSGTPKEALDWLAKAMLQKVAIASTARRPYRGKRSSLPLQTTIPSPENPRNNSSMGNRSVFSGLKTSFGSGRDHFRPSPAKEDPAKEQPIVQFNNKMRNPFAGHSPDIGTEEGYQSKFKFLGNHGPCSQFDCISEHEEENIDVSMSHDLENSQFVSKKYRSESKKSETESSDNSEKSEEIFRKLGNGKKKKNIVVEGSSDEGVQYVVDENFFEEFDQASEPPGDELSKSSGSDEYGSEQNIGKKNKFRTDIDFDKRYGYFYDNRMKTGEKIPGAHLSRMTHGTMISCHPSIKDNSMVEINNSSHIVPSYISSDRMSNYPCKADSNESDDFEKNAPEKKISSG